MHIERFGRGPKHYLGLHGWNGDHRTFLPLVDALPADVTFLSVDLPGCGKSPEPARWDLESIAQEVACAVDRPCTLVGNCSGGVMALLVARRLPARVNRVVLIDAFATWPWYFRIFLSKRIGRYAYFATFANPVGRWLTNASLRSKRKTGTDLTRGFAESDHDATYRYLSMLRGAGTAEEFAGLSMAIDVLYGARSFSAVKKSARKWAGIWPRARLFELSGAGHLPIVEAAPQVKQILFGDDPCTSKQATSFQTCAL